MSQSNTNILQSPDITYNNEKAKKSKSEPSKFSLVNKFTKNLHKYKRIWAVFDAMRYTYVL